MKKYEVVLGNLSDEELAQREADREAIYAAVGRAIAHWARLEHAFEVAFSLALRADLHVCSRVMRTGNSFSAKNKMLSAAIKAGRGRWCDDDRYVQLMQVLEKCRQKAGDWSFARNALAHDDIDLASIRGIYVGGIVAPRTNDQTTDAKTLTTNAVLECAASFKQLCTLMQRIFAAHDEAQIEALAAEVEALPLKPYSQSLKDFLGET